MNGLVRNCATPLSFLTFIGVGLTGVLMFFDVRSHLLGELHEWIGIVFVVALALHLIRNWRGVVAMLKTPSGKWIGGVLGVAAVALVLLAAPWGSGGGNGHGGGGPWRVVRVMSDAPIEKLAPALGLTGSEAVARLQAAGVHVESANESLAKIESDHGERLPRLFNLLLPQRNEEDAD